MALENGKIMNLMKSKILRIKGDASFRKFYRLILNKKSKIIVIARKEKYKNLVAYTAINKFLRSNGILAPKLYNHDIQKGIVIIEDFGDKTYYYLLSKNSNKFIIYKKIINLLIKIQKINPKAKIKNNIKGFHRINKYSKKYLFEETDLFFDWYLPIFLTKEKVLKIKNKSRKVLNKIYNKLNFPNSYFVHRDFHAQNLMKVGKKIGVIDSQDALIGNPAYDLVSLIDDVRIKTSSKLKKKLYSYYLNKTLKTNKNDAKKFLEDFNILSVQRNLKIIGIFSRLFKRDKKKHYLKFIPYAWQLLEMRMKQKFFYELKYILDKNISKKFRKKLLRK